MGAKRKPRRQSKAVYRRRRLLLLIVTLLLVAGIAIGATFGIRWLAEAKPWENLPFVGNDPVAAETPDPIPTIYPTSAPQSPGPSESASPEPEDPEACVPGALEITAHTDKNEYGGDEKPKFTLELTNTGDVACIVDVGTRAQQFTVASGVDEWWRSGDCQQDASENWVTIDAGQTASTDPLTWDRTRSYPDTCDASDRPQAAGGGATYSLTVKLGEVASQPTAFILH
ncbi:hypothetical protein GCM10010915_08580 [Microbacterium faecale]|uniref:DUF4232 domain-containing protein n=1 Tax=Microbacterium faecale TaxID=1804630 RepID=A0A917DE32_9MICO|nr:hypothetical protein [Microbacterium faecale]GGD30563.1 hypothetical protein GCM10010915_08580 [Microbacterium faecale]